MEDFGGTYITIFLGMNMRIYKGEIQIIHFTGIFHDINRPL